MIKFEFNNIKILKDFSKFSWNTLIFYSVYIWVKKSMDLWVDDKLFNEFKIFCAEYNIYLKYDVKFVETSNYSIYKNVIWSENLTTTKTIGEDIYSNNNWKIHCFISIKKEYVEWLYKFWWYPIVVWNRVIYKNFHDLSEFWNYLWYPDCCIKFFFEKNDWRFYNFPYEIFNNSSVFDYRCNSFWKDYFWISYIYHMPCNFWCLNTINYVQKIIDKLSKDDISIVEQIEKYLLFPILSIREQKMYAFDWYISEDNNSIFYKTFFHLWKKSEMDISNYLFKWNLIKIEWDYINIYSYEEIIYSYNYTLSDEIEKPFIIQFKKY